MFVSYGKAEYTTELGYNLIPALDDYLLAQTNITDPLNASNESNATLFTPAYAGLTLGYILQFGNYSWDNTMYVVFGTNSTNPSTTGYTCGIEWEISGVRTVEWDMYVYYANTTVAVVLDPTTGKAIRIDFYSNNSIRYTSFGFESSNVTWIEGVSFLNKWIHVIVSYEEPIANVPFEAHIWMENISAYILLQDSAITDPEQVQITASRLTVGDDVALIKVDNIALYSKYVSDVEEVIGTPSVVFASITKMFVAIMPIFLTVGLIGVLIQKFKKIKFKE